MKDPIYITGHRHPDTDSIASAIGYAFYKKAMGIPAVACRLGEVNAETRYLLDRFHIQEPVLLEDARKSLREIEIDPPVSVQADATLYETIEKMKSSGCASLAVVDRENRIVGMVSRSDLSSLMLADTAEAIELISCTSAFNICKTVNGTMVHEALHPHINGKISIIARAASGLERYDVKDRIAIVGDDPEGMRTLIQRGAGMLIAVWTEKIEESVIAMAKEAECTIILSGHGSMNTSRFIYFAPPVHLIMKEDLVGFHIDELAEEVGRKLLQTRYRQYPVLNSDGTLAGYVSRYHIMNYENKKLILVDHNEFSQSVRSVEKAQLLEVLDHHRIHDFMTSRPVSFRSEIVGSTATIVATIFRENQIPMPAGLAGLLLGAILSDTMNFQSPTTTQKDHSAANILAALAGLDVEEFSKEMFTAQAVDPDSSIQDMIDSDIKYFDFDHTRVMISQVVVEDPCAMVKRNEEVLHEMEEYVKAHGLDLLLVVFTSVLQNGSIVYAAGSALDLAHEAFQGKEQSHELITGLLSRKLQVLPMICEAASHM